MGSCNLDITAISQKIKSITKRSKSFCTFNWHIPRFNVICPEDATTFTRMTSPPFTAGDETDKSSWYVALVGTNSGIDCYLHLNPTVKMNNGHLAKGLMCKFQMGLGSSTDRFVVTNSTEHRYTKEMSSWGYIPLIKIRNLYNQSDALLANDTLRICIQMEIEADLDTQTDPIQPRLILNSPREEVRLDSILNDLDHLYESTSMRFTDIVIRCGGISFPCHKVFLSARSSVFRAMLESDITEANKNEVLIEDIEPTALAAILRYMYTGKAECPMSCSWTDLIHGAEKYDLTELKDFCFSQMLDGLNEENAGILAVAAHTYNAQKITKKIVNKFCLDNIKTLIRNHEFKNLLAKNPNAFFEAEVTD